jgi:sphingomyelin phosphodiesterase acid-like 3
MTDAKFVDRLALADVDRWQTILEGSPAKSPSRYGQDSNWPLLRSALEQAKGTIPAPAFVLLPGDFLAHNFRREFDATAADHSDAAYRLFVRKTMQFVALQLASTFPDMPILPALGNNDDLCGDYRLQPKGPFLADISAIVRAPVGGIVSPGFDRDWESRGNYSVALRALRIIFPSTVFFSPHYQNACGSADIPDPAQATLAWLETGIPRSLACPVCRSSSAYWPADLADGERAGRAALAYHCAIGNVALSGYGQCYCGDAR